MGSLSVLFVNTFCLNLKIVIQIGFDGADDQKLRIKLALHIFCLPWLQVEWIIDSCSIWLFNNILNLILLERKGYCGG